MSAFKKIPGYIPKADRLLIEEALVVMKRKIKPDDLCLATAHEPERESWYRVEISSMESFLGSIRISNLEALSTEGVEYFLPLLLSSCLATDNGVVPERLADFLSEISLDFVAALPSAEKGLVSRLATRIVEIVLSSDPDTANTFPCLSSRFEDNTLLVQVLDSMLSQFASSS